MDREIGKIDLIAYADGELSPVRCAEVEEYLDQHPALRTEVESIRQLKRAAHDALLEAPHTPGPSEALIARVTEILTSPVDQDAAAGTQTARSKLVRTATVRSWRRYALAASLGLAVMSALAIHFYSRNPWWAASSNDPSVVAVAAVRKHLTCSQVADHFYDRRFPRVIADVPAVAAGYLGSDVPVVD